MTANPARARPRQGNLGVTSTFAVSAVVREAAPFRVGAAFDQGLLLLLTYVEEDLLVALHMLCLIQCQVDLSSS